MKRKRLFHYLQCLLILTVISILVFSLPMITIRSRLKLLNYYPILKTPQKYTEEGSSNAAKQVNFSTLPPPSTKPSCQLSDLSSLTSSPDSPTSPIPRLVHWVYKTEDVPNQYIVFVQKCQQLNPDHHFVFWTDKSALAFVKDKYPNYHYLFVKHFKDGLEFSDALRYFIILHFGGVYLDLDVECLRPFTKAMKSYSCVLDREREVQTRVYWNLQFFAMNSVMACQRNHPFFKHAIDMLKISAVKAKGILARTGPDFLTGQFRKYNDSSLGRSRPVIVAPSSVFSPLMDENHFPIFRRICEAPGPKKGFRKAACEEYKRNGYGHGDIKELTKDSIAIHHYMHLGWGSWKFKIKTLTSMCEKSRVFIYKP